MNSIKTLSVFLLVQLLSQCSHGQRKPFFRKDYTFVEATQSFYKVHTNRRAWLEAKNRCELEGATLLYPDDDVEADVAWGLWNKTEPYDWIYLGMSDLLAEGVWETVEGRPELEVYSNWRSGEPDNANNIEHCALWRRDKTLNDYRCDERYPFICRKTLLSLDSNTPCDLTDPNQPKPTSYRNDYTFIKESDAFYKVHTIRKNFQDAKRRCQIEGAILFHPENDAEAEIVMGLWNRSEPYGWIYIGITDLLQKGVWETVDGRPLLDVYTNWGKAPDQPDDTGGIEDCGLWRRDKTLNDYSCHEKYPFICKKTRRSLDANILCDIPHQNTKPAAFFRKDYIYKQETQAFYKVHTARKVWLEARKQCQMEGATLFYPEDKAESEVVLGLWKKSEPYEWMYLGMSDLLSEGNWETVDGRPDVAMYNMWRTSEGEPDNAGGIEDCSLWRRSDNSNNDYRCDEEYPFICKKSLRDLDWNTPCDMADPNYLYNKDLRKCYKFHLTPKNWNDAHAICNAEQSYLAIINSQSEAEFLAKFTEQAPKDKFKGNFVSGRVHLGFHNKHNAGWKTIRGMSLQDSGYTAWEYLPDLNDHWTCGSMFYNSHLVNVDCSERSFFICEHDIGLLSNTVDEKFALLHSSVGQSN